MSELLTIKNTVYPLAKNGIFRTIQGEGALLGKPMAFVRLAGCSVGCAECDTDYRVSERLPATEIGKRVDALNCEWSWVTGGEPADHDLWALLEALRLCGRVAVATSGTRRISTPSGLIDFLSVSPHGKPSDLQVVRGSQINLVPGLNRLNLADWEAFDYSGYKHCFVTPCDGKPESLSECLLWIDKHPRFRLGVQAHKVWGLA